MALVVLLKGINVGGHHRFRPSLLAQELKRFDVVNIGATGTFIVRKPITRTRLRAEIQRRLPFQAQIVICSGTDILRLAADDPFAGQSSDRNIVHFVSALAKKGKLAAPLPVSLPSERDWCVRVLEQRDRFVLGVYRREMRTIRYLDQLETLFGAPVTSTQLEHGALDRAGTASLTENSAAFHTAARTARPALPGFLQRKSP